MPEVEARTFGELTAIDWTSRDDMICGGQARSIPATRFEPHIESIDITLRAFKSKTLTILWGSPKSL